MENRCSKMNVVLASGVCRSVCCTSFQVRVNGERSKAGIDLTLKNGVLNPLCSFCEFPTLSALLWRGLVELGPGSWQGFYSYFIYPRLMSNALLPFSSPNIVTSYRGLTVTVQGSSGCRHHLKEPSHVMARSLHSRGVKQKRWQILLSVLVFHSEQGSLWRSYCTFRLLGPRPLQLSLQQLSPFPPFFVLSHSHEDLRGCCTQHCDRRTARGLLTVPALLCLLAREFLRALLFLSRTPFFVLLEAVFFVDFALFCFCAFHTNETSQWGCCSEREISSTRPRVNLPKQTQTLLFEFQPGEGFVGDALDLCNETSITG